jgi:uncharacterized membrane protein
MVPRMAVWERKKNADKANFVLYIHPIKIEIVTHLISENNHHSIKSIISLIGFRVHYLENAFKFFGQNCNCYSPIYA